MKLAAMVLVMILGGGCALPAEGTAEQTAAESDAAACAPAPALDALCVDAGANYLVPGDGLPRAAWQCDRGAFDFSGTMSPCAIESTSGQLMTLCCTP